MPLSKIFLGLDVDAGMAICEARACRLNPKGAIGYIDRAVFAARAAMRRKLNQEFEIIP